MTSEASRSHGPADDAGPAFMVASPDPASLASLPTFSGLWALFRSPAELTALLSEPDSRRWLPPGRRIVVAPVDAALVAASIPFRTRGAGGPFPDPAPGSTIVGTGFLNAMAPIPQLLARETRLPDGWCILDPEAPRFEWVPSAPPVPRSLETIEQWLAMRYGEPFLSVSSGAVESRRFVAPASLRVVDVFPEADAPHGSSPLGQGVAALLIDSGDLSTFWADAMLRAEAPDRALALFETLDTRQPVPIEVLPRVQRWWLPASGYLVELRGRGTLQSTRLASPDDGRRALASMIAVASLPELELAFAGLSAVGSMQMALNGAIWLEGGPSSTGEGRLRLASPETIGAVLAQQPDLTTVSSVDAFLARLKITAVDRLETAGPGGIPRVQWRLRECGAALIWDAGLRVDASNR